MHWIPRVLFLAFMLHFGDHFMPSTVSVKEIGSHLARVPATVSYELYSGWISFHQDVDVVSRQMEHSRRLPLLSLENAATPGMSSSAGPLCVASAAAKHDTKTIQNQDR